MLFLLNVFRAQSYPIKLPQNFTCTDCTIRLLREAKEWGSSYRFWSCADIDVSNIYYLHYSSIIND